MLRFKLHHFVFSLLLTTFWAKPARAMGVHFELATADTGISQTAPPKLNRSLPQQRPNLLLLNRSEPLPVPPEAGHPPISKNQAPHPSNIVASTRILAPPAALPTSRIYAPQTPASADTIATENTIGLRFSGDTTVGITKAATAQSSPFPEKLTIGAQEFPGWIYAGESDSLVSRVIGSAEGTRTPDGRHTRAYYGHTDPGNGVWNLGTFSYQHGASSPDEADRKQLKRLKKQGKTIARQAHQAELKITLGEILNGLDLANQAPKAALETGGYIDRLAQARQKGMQPDTAIVWARTYSYMDPHTQRWNAPGLGNTLTSIERDQQRRYDAVERAFHSYQAQLNRAHPQSASLDLAQLPPVKLSVVYPQVAKADTPNKPVPAAATVSLADSLEFGISDISEPLPMIPQPPQSSARNTEVTAKLPSATPTPEPDTQENSFFEQQSSQSPG